MSLISTTASATTVRAERIATDRAPATVPVDGLAEAQQAAARSGHQVEAVSERTETTTTWANGDGTVTVDYHAAPIRLPDEDAADGWRTVDADLVRAAKGSYAAKAHPAGLRLAGAYTGKGTAPLIRMGSGDQALTLGWQGTLPEPSVDGDTATYRDALPATDIVVEATRTGAEQYVVLKNRTATDSGTFTLPLSAPGLTARRGLDGSVFFLDRSSGLPVGSIPAPVMWDSTTDERSGEHLHRGKVTMDVVQRGDSVDLRLSADPAFLKDDRTRYPVTIDPALKLGDTFDTFVQQGYGTDQSHATELKLGNNGSGQIARSFMSFATGSLSGKHILSSSLNLYEYHSWSCSPRAWEVWSTGAASASTRWTNQPAWTAKSASSTATKGFSSTCAAGYVSADTTTLVKDWATKGATVGNLGLRATDESDAYGWKRFNSSDATSNDPYLSVTYNTKPGTPTVSAPTPGGTDGNQVYVTSTAPSFAFRTSDADNNALTANWEVTEGAATVASGTTASAAAGSTVNVKIPAGKLTDGHTYGFRARTTDSTDTSAWSSSTAFKVDLSKAPPAPADLPQAPRTGGAETLNPILSGVITAPGAGTPTAEFVLRTSAGAVVGSTPLASVSVESGKRAALEIGDGIVTDGASYTWQMRACTAGGCSAYTTPNVFTVKVPTPPVQPDPVTVTLPVTTDASVPSGDARPVQDGLLRVGAQDSTHWRTYLKPDLSGLPGGARIVGATLTLDAAGCLGICEAHQIETHPLNDPWDPADGGFDSLSAAESVDAYATSAADPAALDLTDAVTQWFSDPESNNGLAVRAGDEESATTTGITYISSRSSEVMDTRPRLRVAYLPATAPGKPTEVRADAGDKGLVATWNTPQDTGTSAMDDLTFRVTVLDSGDTQVAEATTTDRRAVFDSLDNGTGYTVEVAAVNAHGPGQTSRSGLVRPSAAAADEAALKDVVKQFTTASDGLLSGTYPTVDAALAASTRASSFETLLRAQAPSILADRAANTRHDIAYRDFTSDLSQAVVSTSGSTATLRLTRTGARTEVDGGDTSDPIEEETDEEYVFALAGAGQPPVLQRISDDRDVYSELPSDESVRVAVTSESTDADEAPETLDAPAVATDADGFSSADPDPAPVAARASLNRSGAAAWAKKHAGDKDEFGTDCTNFVSKALNRGGKMGMKRPGWYRSDHYWWRSYGFLGNQTYSWAASNHLFSFFNKEAKVTWRAYDSQATPGDVVFWQWKSNKPIQHASMVISKSGSRVTIAQHTSKHRTTTMASARSRNHPRSVWIAHVTPRW
ncbi:MULTISPECIES: DNRLRE domain-containing protein [unclassified Streptomyces]|uniref:DNRLRE domain-containing protein n=1 Tax=unclassified Streptomyces TaxID=2593676 RepID=UPI0029B88DBE|nr:MULTISPECIES: DNRLRE domain-containing protein [unclassified Streptomyces]MDX3765287.1 DNRLRE domain-containing protein [Streptomyces sp. AK08-01B]MDX3814866.1 DNRLRE domain-containing protein [Streptomyces sp. AK08-01A]